VGRDVRAATDAQMHAEILSCPGAGLFAGLDLSGGMLRPDKDANEEFYGRSMNPRDILGNVGGHVDAGVRSDVRLDTRPDGQAESKR
jgi:lipid-binding SYLF domain-containing protein